MTDKELKALLKETDKKFAEAKVLATKVGRAIVEKAVRDVDVKLTFSLGWTEAGVDALCLYRADTEQDGEKCDRYYYSVLEPLFRGLQIFYLDSPFGFTH